MTDQFRMGAFDCDDTLWRSQDFFDAAEVECERIVGGYVDLADARVSERLYAFEKANLAWFGYGVKGMALSMIEAAVEITGQRVAAADVQRIVGLAKDLLRHRSEEHTSELQSLMRISYAVFCLKKKKTHSTT